jgi:hypothetical protein
MSKRKNLQVVFPLNSEEDFLKAVADSDRYLTVIDIHQGWSGPCTIMDPLYRKAFIELEQPEQRLKCYTIEAEKLSPQSRTGLPVNDSCKPLFVVYKVGGVGRLGRALFMVSGCCSGRASLLDASVSIMLDFWFPLEAPTFSHSHLSQLLTFSLPRLLLVTSCLLLPAPRVAE